MAFYLKRLFLVLQVETPCGWEKKEIRGNQSVCSELPEWLQCRTEPLLTTALSRKARQNVKHTKCGLWFRPSLNLSIKHLFISASFLSLRVQKTCRGYQWKIPVVPLENLIRFYWCVLPCAPILESVMLQYANEGLATQV